MSSSKLRGPSALPKLRGHEPLSARPTARPPKISVRFAQLRHRARLRAEFSHGSQGGEGGRGKQRHKLSKATSFRWRHRFLSLTKNDRPASLNGIAEPDGLYQLEPQKGARKLARPLCKRGGVAKKRGISDEQICILGARDHTGQTVDFCHR